MEERRHIAGVLPPPRPVRAPWHRKRRGTETGVGRSLEPDGTSASACGDIPSRSCGLDCRPSRRQSGLEHKRYIVADGHVKKYLLNFLFVFSWGPDLFLVAPEPGCICSKGRRGGASGSIGA